MQKKVFMLLKKKPKKELFLKTDIFFFTIDIQG